MQSVGVQLLLYLLLLDLSTVCKYIFAFSHHSLMLLQGLFHNNRRSVQGTHENSVEFNVFVFRGLHNMCEIWKGSFEIEQNQVALSALILNKLAFYQVVVPLFLLVIGGVRITFFTVRFFFFIIIFMLFFLSIIIIILSFLIFIFVFHCNCYCS